MALLFFNLNLNPHIPKKPSVILAEFDFLGLATIMSSVVLLIVGFNLGGENWGSAGTIVCLVLGCILLVVAGYVEIKTTKAAIVPRRLFKTRTTAFILCNVFSHAFAFIGASYYLPLYFQVLGASALLSGVKLIPYSLGSAIVSIVSGFAVAKSGKYRPIISGSFFFMTLGFCLLATLDSNSSV